MSNTQKTSEDKDNGELTDPPTAVAPVHGTAAAKAAAKAEAEAAAKAEAKAKATAKAVNVSIDKLRTLVILYATSVADLVSETRQNKRKSRLSKVREQIQDITQALTVSEDIPKRFNSGIKRLKVWGGNIPPYTETPNPTIDIKKLSTYNLTSVEQLGGESNTAAALEAEAKAAVKAAVKAEADRVEAYNDATEAYFALVAGTAEGDAQAKFEAKDEAANAALKVWSTAKEKAEAAKKKAAAKALYDWVDTFRIICVDCFWAGYATNYIAPKTSIKSEFAQIRLPFWKWGTSQRLIDGRRIYSLKCDSCEQVTQMANQKKMRIKEKISTFGADNVNPENKLAFDQICVSNEPERVSSIRAMIKNMKTAEKEFGSSAMVNAMYLHMVRSLSEDDALYVYYAVTQWRTDVVNQDSAEEVQDSDEEVQDSDEEVQYSAEDVQKRMNDLSCYILHRGMDWVYRACAYVYAKFDEFIKAPTGTTGTVLKDARNLFYGIHGTKDICTIRIAMTVAAEEGHVFGLLLVCKRTNDIPTVPTVLFDYTVFDVNNEIELGEKYATALKPSETMFTLLKRTFGTDNTKYFYYKPTHGPTHSHIVLDPELGLCLAHTDIICKLFVSLIHVHNDRTSGLFTALSTLKANWNQSDWTLSKITKVFVGHWTTILNKKKMNRLLAIEPLVKPAQFKGGTPEKIITRETRETPAFISDTMKSPVQSDSDKPPVETPELSLQRYVWLILDDEIEIDQDSKNPFTQFVSKSGDVDATIEVLLADTPYVRVEETFQQLALYCRNKSLDANVKLERIYLEHAYQQQRFLYQLMPQTDDDKADLWPYLPEGKEIEKINGILTQLDNMKTELDKKQKTLDEKPETTGGASKTQVAPDIEMLFAKLRF